MSMKLSLALAGIIKSITSIQREERAIRNRLLVRDLLTDYSEIKTKRGNIKLICRDRREVHYVKHFFDREPDTLNWIEEFAETSIFWDVGANTGIYSIYAALGTNVKVFAFEPASASYASLCNNIAVNSLDGDIISLCMGFFNSTELTKLSMQEVEAGGAMHGFSALDLEVEKDNQSCILQSTLSFSIDEFVEIYNLSSPNYLKIDVDGVEDRILSGASKTLQSKNLRSVLIETAGRNADDNEKLHKLFEGFGFTENKKINYGHDTIFFKP